MFLHVCVYIVAIFIKHQNDSYSPSKIGYSNAQVYFFQTKITDWFTDLILDVIKDR